LWGADIAGLLRLDTIPTGLFDGLVSLEILDTVDLHGITSLPPEPFRALTRLRTFIAHFWGIRSLDRPFATCARLASVEISSSTSFTLSSNLFFGATALAAVTFNGNQVITSIPAGLFEPARSTLTTLVIRYCDPCCRPLSRLQPINEPGFVPVCVRSPFERRMSHFQIAICWW
jgi:hypothetical protein